MELNKVADYIIRHILAAGGDLSNLKLHKLMYYTQAWHLAIHGEPLFEGKFQAWIHGPVSRPLYDRFKDSKMLYSDMTEADIESDLSDMSIDRPEVQHIENVLEVYGGYTGTQLEIATHREKPWRAAREGYQPNERCEQEIDENLMQKYYSKRLES